MTREQILAIAFLKALTRRVPGHPVCRWYGNASAEAFLRLREQINV